MKLKLATLSSAFLAALPLITGTLSPAHADYVVRQPLGYVSASAPVLGSFVVPGLALGSFGTLTPPTSNSAGLWSYASSDAAVATVSGDVVTPVGVGSTTITATQAAFGGYTAATVSAQLTVGLSVPVLGSFSIPDLMLGDQGTLVPPTSGSDGPWSYVSSDPAVATITGATVTPISVGSTTITATQAASGNYAAATISAQLTVLPSACTPFKMAYSYTGADQVVTVPNGCHTAVIKAWGAGGKSAGESPNVCSGGGGFAERTVANLSSGAQLRVVVGQGAASTAATYGGGGAGSSAGYGAAGGGLSGVFLGSVTQADALVVAGGGGSSYFSTGGGGGGTEGGASGPYTNKLWPAGGGTQAAGGARGSWTGNTWGYSGSALQGGSGAATYGVGGGGGYWGGGGTYAFGSGGGSGYAPGGSLAAGGRPSVANAADPDYAAGVGNGSCVTGTAGQHGRVVIQWQ